MRITIPDFSELSLYLKLKEGMASNTRICYSEKYFDENYEYR